MLKSNIGNILLSRFCYNAVCNDCSPLQAMHPENGRKERICMNCYVTNVKKNQDAKSVMPVTRESPSPKRAIRQDITDDNVFSDRKSFFPEPERKVPFDRTMDTESILQDSSLMAGYEEMLLPRRSEANMVNNYIMERMKELEDRNKTLESQIERLSAQQTRSGHANAGACTSCFIF